MAKFSPYPRREYGRLFRTWARRNLKTLALFGVGVTVLLAVETALIVVLVVPASSFRWWLLGALQAAIVAAALHLVNAAFLAHEREGIWQLRGAWGEEATRDELRRAKKKRTIWGWVDSINLEAGDLDHLVVTAMEGSLPPTPNGAVTARTLTRWRGQPPGRGFGPKAWLAAC